MSSSPSAARCPRASYGSSESIRCRFLRPRQPRCNMESLREVPREEGAALLNDPSADVDRPQRTSAKRSLPYWVIGLLLLALVAVLVGVAFILNSALRPKVGTEGVTTAN